MRIAAFFLAASLLAAPVSAAPPKAGQFFTYVPDAQSSPVAFTVDGVSIRITKKPDPLAADMAEPVFTISAKGMKPVTVHGELAMGHSAHQVAAGRLNKGDALPSVLIQSYSGGAHCCTSIIAVVPVGAAFKVASLGAWDGEGLAEFPKDISGDGVADFVLVDNSFLYAFASYADSWAPPLIMNVKAGKAVDVSSNAAFRKLYEADLVRARKHCLGQSPDVGYRNGACAAYGADAAMLGRYPAARAEIAKHHQTEADWDYPTGCRVAETAQGCPEGKRITYSGFPQALDAFLKREGYLP